MALQKEIVLDNGIVTNYHIIKEVNVNYVEQQTIIVVNNYVSKDIRENLNRIEELETGIDSFKTQMQEAEAKGQDELEKSMRDKLHQLSHEYNEITSKTFEANVDRILLDNIPEDISLSAVYKLLKTTDKYSKAKKV